MQLVQVDSVFSNNECDEVVANAQSLEFFKSTIQRDSKYVVDESIRSVTSVNLKDLENIGWVSYRLNKVISSVQSYFSFNLLPISESNEPIFLLKYEQGSHYDWHTDIGRGEIPTRRLTLIVQLSDPNDYVGATTFVNMNKTVKSMKNKGSITVFPSEKKHKVTQLE